MTANLTFDLAAYREAHPDSTPEDARLAHREAIVDALHDQFLATVDALADQLQLAVLAGKAVRVEIAVADEAPPASPPMLKVIH